MSLYKVHFKWNNKDHKLKARILDLTHPYFVSVKDLVFTRESAIIINPGEDDLRKEFSQTDHLMIPFQSVSLIEEYMDGNPGASPVNIVSINSGDRE